MPTKRILFVPLVCSDVVFSQLIIKATIIILYLSSLYKTNRIGNYTLCYQHVHADFHISFSKDNYSNKPIRTTGQI